MASHCLAITLGCVLACGAVGAARGQPITQARAPARVDIDEHVRDAAQRFGIPEAWIYAVIRIESAGRTRAVSSAGAMGLMQLMPGTWARQRARFVLGEDPFDPRDNIMAGTSYLREMYDRYGAAGFLAAYNAGPGRYEEWRDKGRPLPLETRHYVASMTALLQPERIPIASAMQPAGSAARLAPVTNQHVQPAKEEPGQSVPANPFARTAMPGHDLFAPVTTASDR